jgi:hypothetical protein
MNIDIVPYLLLAFAAVHSRRATVPARNTAAR